MIWTTDNVQRIILDVAGRILKIPHAGLPTQVRADLDLSLDLGLDSLRRMELAAYLNELFGLLQTSATNYLLAGTTLEHWTNCILRARSDDDRFLTFRTSGTGGATKSITHSMASLVSEAQFLAQLLAPPGQIISSVPANHIYGFLYTVLLPSLWKRPMRLLTDVSMADIEADSLLVGTPFTWQFIDQSFLGAAKLPCRGVSSTAPMPPGLFTRLMEAGVSLTEVYGSSDTGGLGFRHAPDAPFVLFPYVVLSRSEPLTVTRTDTSETFVIPDRLEQLSSREIRLLGRLDDAVQIAGVNVYPTHIRQIIEQCPLVAECDVYAKAVAGDTQLYAAVHLRALSDSSREACLRWIRQHLSAPELPNHLYLY
ncbi:phosphopantetheine-binding protein [Spirosoma sordidisoli]|uniref:4-coumarate--CoA ligase n=1 Tax=Spirosoma sordidisoli TaxID=2502893 RepID=A0A4Q2UHI8_9BACT|nr:phosphopantetheine-binding protein [Spirosoma sordidisoli]RYC68867.1 4-coumarate--CoA ligase [Spirosoma sordidisoli]